MEKKQEIKSEKKARYDRDLKQVIVTIDQTNPLEHNGIEIGKNVGKIIQYIGSDHIRKIHAQMYDEISNLKKEISKLSVNKSTWDLSIDGFEQKDLKLLQGQLKALQKYDKQETDKTTLENMVNRLKVLEKDLKDLTPIVNQIPKK